MNNKVSKEVLRRVEDYLHAGTVESGATREPLTAIASTLGLSSATVHRAVEVLRTDGRVSITRPRVPGLPQEIRHLAMATDDGAEASVKLTLDRIWLPLSDVESRIDRMHQEPGLCMRGLPYIGTTTRMWRARPLSMMDGS